ncbi:MAG: hypothetical protein BKP49_09760 [Treponema sp. CETP13]|nr:MAG: hypothetical protein BKP49_09760 [Treponema sp. CETP13]
MKKINNYRVFISIVLLLCCSIAFAFGGRPPKKAVTVTVIGHVNVYGSMPHTYLGIVTEDKKAYTIIAEKDVLAQLQKNQGKTIAFTGEIIPRNDKKNKDIGFQTLKDGNFKLKSWEIIPK